MRKLAGVILAASFSASCGGGGTDEPTTGAANPGQGPLSDPVLVNEQLISLSDTSATESAIAQGLDPEALPIPDIFNCYAINATDVTDPALQLTMRQGNYSTDAGLGFHESDSAGHLRFSGGELDAAQARVGFDSHGQYFSVNREGSADLQCFQAGASHARAFHRFRLNTPAVGNYDCTEGDSSERLEIVEGSKYIIGSQLGGFTLSDIIDSNASTLTFDSGPLSGLSTIYAEDPDSGLQQFDLSGGTAFAAFGFPTRVSIECQRAGAPRPFKRFSVTPAPTPPTPSVAYPTDTNSGMFYNYAGNSSAKNNSHLARFFYFQRDGYMFAGIPDYQSVDCDRTLPNGLPQCHYYDTDGSTLTATSATGETETYSLTLDSDGGIQAIDGNAIERVGPIDLAALIGVWLNTAQFDAGCFGDDVCYSFARQNVVRFDESGRFIKDSTDAENLDLSTRLAAPGANESSTASVKGDYNVVANRVRLRFDNGVLDDHWIYLTNDDRLVVDNLVYSRQ